jgi:hypothetical protein
MFPTQKEIGDHSSRMRQNPKYSSTRRQKVEGKKVCTVSFLTFFNWVVISAMLH